MQEDFVNNVNVKGHSKIILINLLFRHHRNKINNRTVKKSKLPHGNVQRPRWVGKNFHFFFIMWTEIWNGLRKLNETKNRRNFADKFRRRRFADEFRRRGRPNFKSPHFTVPLAERFVKCTYDRPPPFWRPMSHQSVVAVDRSPRPITPKESPVRRREATVNKTTILLLTERLADVCPAKSVKHCAASACRATYNQCIEHAVHIRIRVRLCRCFRRMLVLFYFFFFIPHATRPYGFL